jgi:hypothetical protein
VKIYRVKDGVIVQDGTGVYSFETDWDEVINRDDLTACAYRVRAGPAPRTATW